MSQDTEQSQRRKLSRKQLEVLRKMRDEACDLVYEGRSCFVGNESISPRTVNALLRLMALRGCGFPKTLERYTINETGLLILREAGL